MKILIAFFVMFLVLAGVLSASVAQEEPPIGSCDPLEDPKPTKK